MRSGAQLVRIGGGPGRPPEAGILQPEHQRVNRGERDEGGKASGKHWEGRLTKTEERNPSSGQH